MNFNELWLDIDLLRDDFFIVYVTFYIIFCLGIDIDFIGLGYWLRIGLGTGFIGILRLFLFNIIWFNLYMIYSVNRSGKIILRVDKLFYISWIL